MIRKSFYIVFFLKKEQKNSKGELALYCRILMGRKEKAEFGMKEYVHPDYWNNSQGRINAATKGHLHINHLISETETKLRDIHYRLNRDNMNVTAKYIKNILIDGTNVDKPTLLSYFMGYIETIDKLPREYGPGVRLHYRCARRHLDEFLQTKGQKDLQIHKFTSGHFHQFEQYLLTKINKVLGKPMNRGTANKYMKKLKTVLKRAVKEGLITRSPGDDLVIKNHKVTKVHIRRTKI